VRARQNAEDSVVPALARAKAASGARTVVVPEMFWLGIWVTETGVERWVRAVLQAGFGVVERWIIWFASGRSFPGCWADVYM
jgi:hypothetical protein